MDLRITKFKVRYQGQDYGPGSVIYGVADDTAKALIAGSNGDIEELPARQATIESVASNDTGTTAEN